MPVPAEDTKDPMQMPLRPGDVLAGKYRVERAIGQGGMGIVVAARHLDLDELFAVKLLSPSALSNASAVERFLREARALVRLKGEHTAKVIDVGRLESGAPYMVMELLEGTDFKRLLKTRGPLPADEAAAYLLDACEAIAEAHALGIVHRDIKPANLFLAERAVGGPCVKVLDFGISKQLAREEIDITSTGTVLGSPAYMSPEQMLRTRAADQRSDIWALGAVLYELVTGALPFDGDVVTEVVARVLNEEPELPSRVRPDLPAWVDEVVVRCLKKKPDERFQTVAELGEILQLHAASPQSRFSAGQSRQSAPESQSGDGGAMPSSGVMPSRVSSTGATWDRTAAQPARARGGPGLFAIIAGVIVALGGAAVWLLKAPSGGGDSASTPASGAIEVTAPGASDRPASTVITVEPALPEPSSKASAAPVSQPAEPTSQPAAPASASAIERPAKPAVAPKPPSAPKPRPPGKHEGIY